MSKQQRDAIDAALRAEPQTRRATRHNDQIWIARVLPGSESTSVQNGGSASVLSDFRRYSA
jgi:hypothetical protein